MTVRELNRDQLAELKVNYYTENVDENISYGEIADIDNLVTDEEVFTSYEGTIFTEEDFNCSCEEEEEDNTDYKSLYEKQKADYIKDMNELLGVVTQAQRNLPLSTENLVVSGNLAFMKGYIEGSIGIAKGYMNENI